MSGSESVMPTKVTIGAVVFWKAGKPFDRETEPMGAERIAALRAFYRGEPIPGGLEPHADWYHGSYKLNHAGVAWETAGERVTGVRA